MRQRQSALLLGRALVDEIHRVGKRGKYAVKLQPQVLDAGRKRGSTPLCIAGLLVAALGVGFAFVDASRGEGLGSPDGSFGGNVTAPAEDDLVQPTASARPVAAAATGVASGSSIGGSEVDLADQAARARQADALIDRLLEQIRAERKAKVKARAQRRQERKQTR
jgi:hypothetical protein